MKKLPNALIEDNSLFTAIKGRRTNRKIDSTSLSDQILSDILFAACGETKAAKGKTKNKRTIPSGCNAQKVTVYCALEEGVFHYKETDHTLELVAEGNHISKITKQAFFKEVPLVLLYVATWTGTSGAFKITSEQEGVFIGSEIGAMTQNVGLYCAFKELGNTVIGLNDVEYTNKLLDLPEGKTIIFTQAIGHQKQ
jgi:hypothetical protein